MLLAAASAVSAFPLALASASSSSASRSSEAFNLAFASLASSAATSCAASMLRADASAMSSFFFTLDRSSFSSASLSNPSWILPSAMVTCSLAKRATSYLRASSSRVATWARKPGSDRFKHTPRCRSKRLAMKERPQNSHGSSSSFSSGLVPTRAALFGISSSACEMLDVPQCGATEGSSPSLVTVARNPCSDVAAHTR
eukprot:scaffold259990_cov30-Tisochrysis_lutea.AAC.1